MRTIGKDHCQGPMIPGVCLEAELAQACYTVRRIVHFLFSALLFIDEQTIAKAKKEVPIVTHNIFPEVVDAKKECLE